MSDSVYMVHYGNMKTLGFSRKDAELSFLYLYGKEALSKATVSEFVFNQHIQ